MAALIQRKLLKKLIKQDPYAAREAEKYDRPIPSREYILSILNDAASPLNYRQLCLLLKLEDLAQKEALRRRLLAMERDGQICGNRRKAYAPIDKLQLVRGRVQAHRDGYGFLICNSDKGDIYLPYRQMRKVFDGDEVLVRLSTNSPRGRRDGVIVEVLKHHTHQLVGRYFNANSNIEASVGFVRPDNGRLVHDIIIADKDAGDAKFDQFVVVEITRQPSAKNPPMGKIIEVLGDHMAPGMEIDVAIRTHSIPHRWPIDVEAEIKLLADHATSVDKKHRVDLRHLPFVTIDGEDARDFDDAVYCETKRSGGWRLYVAIADVSHYVTVDSALDREAKRRGTSVYFPDFVVPMLPEILSNDLCSLNPQVDRLAMVCEMTISARGKISGYTFYEALIHSHARLTYTQVASMIDHQSDKSLSTDHPRRQFAPLITYIDELFNLYKVLRNQREVRGAIDFDTVETRIVFDKNRKIERIVPVVRNHAHKLIEECMLCANVSAASFLEKHELLGLYRVHLAPKAEKLDNLRLYLQESGISLKTRGQPQPQHFQKILTEIEHRPDAHVIQMVMLRSLQQAVYQPDNQGHFGLAYTAYAHFTSPIRRYPDLLVHRAIRHIIRSRKQSNHVTRIPGAKTLAKASIYPYDIETMQRLGENSSLAERRADEATRDVVSWLKCEYLHDHIGDCFTGIITGVTNFGVFVELNNLYVEGLIHVTALPADYYSYEESRHRLIGKRTRQILSLGDTVQARVAAVNLDERKIDLELISSDKKRRRQVHRKKSLKPRLKTGVNSNNKTGKERH